MDYQRLLQMKEELEGIRSNFVSIDKSREIELDSDDLRNLVDKCIKQYEEVSN